ncbi:S-adenosyl-L-methionine-dependent methyltransferase [Pelomyxa schiedti]|nr:S-adenosyl-L-methionine-dependent methyltransferase [Pelomyxa schiedti]
MDAVHPVARLGFGSNADVYDRGRPEYSRAVIQALCDSIVPGRPGSDTTGTPPHPAVRVADIGCGTGKLTRAILACLPPAASVVAIDPSAAMLEQFMHSTTGYGESGSGSRCVASQGTADRTGRSDAEFDAVFVGQAFHWFANEAAITEMRRILRPSGLLALVWNQDDEDSAEWIRGLRALTDAHLDPAIVPQFRSGAWRAVWRGAAAARLFAPITETVHRGALVHRLTRPQLWDRVQSRSYISVLPSDKKEALKRSIDELLLSVFGADTGKMLEIPINTTVVTTRALSC